jgi:hypothetical protein
MCESPQPLVNFSRNARNKDGLYTYCKACAAVQMKAWRKANAERVRTSTVAWRSANAVRVKEVKAAYHARNKEQINARHAAWRKENHEQHKAACAAWCAKNPARRAALQKKRNAAKLRATPAWANKTAILAYYTLARELSMLTGERYHVDHIVPLQGELVCGLHVENNLQVIPASKNISKGKRLLEEAL